MRKGAGMVDFGWGVCGVSVSFSPLLSVNFSVGTLQTDLRKLLQYDQMTLFLFRVGLVFNVLSVSVCLAVCFGLFGRLFLSVWPSVSVCLAVYFCLFGRLILSFSLFLSLCLSFFFVEIYTIACEAITTGRILRDAIISFCKFCFICYIFFMLRSGK